VGFGVSRQVCGALLGFALLWASPGASAETGDVAGDALDDAVNDVADDAVDDAAGEHALRDDILSHAPMPLTLTTSGGVSLGGYQAGYLYYLSEWMKHNPALMAPVMVTGSSAGSINALLLAIALGKDFSPHPSETLFYKLWSNMQFKELLDVQNAPPLAISSRKAIADMADKMERDWMDGLDKKLDIVVGITATRVNSRPVHLNESFAVQRQEEKFVFRIRGRGPGKEPLIQNYIDAEHGIAQPYLPFVDPDAPGNRGANFAILKKLMYASSAFPLAFPAQELSLCMHAPGDTGTGTGTDTATDTDTDTDTDTKAGPFQCDAPDHHEDFVDGSMFDRNPIGLAFRTTRAGLQRTEDGDIVWRDEPSRHLPQFDDFIMLYLDALHVSYPSYEGAKESKRVQALFPAFGAYSQGYVRSAQGKEMYMLLDDHPEVRDQVGMTVREFPSASGLLANFFGFFDRQFRVFDFYLGMHDAHRYIEQRVGRRLKELGYVDIALNYPEQFVAHHVEEDWAPYFCMRAVLDEKNEYTAACSLPALEEFTTLLQVSLIRLYDKCRELPLDATIDHPHCVRGMQKEAPPLFKPMRKQEMAARWERRGNESEFAYTMRLLEFHDFWFQDLGLKKKDSWLALSRMREELAGALDIYAKKLPRSESLALRILGKPALNIFYYHPPQAIVHIGAGKGAELSLSLAGKYAPARWLRFNFALNIKGIYEALSPAEDAFAVSPVAGVELENPAWSSVLLQPRLGVRVGYQFSTADRFWAGRCNMNRMEGDSRMCSAPVAQFFLAFVFFERIRLQGGVEWFPHFLAPMKKTNSDVWNGFVTVGWQWISPF